VFAAPVFAAAVLACTAAARAAEVSAADEVLAADAQVLVLGEVHDNPDHHAWQAELTARIAPAAVVFEMLSPEQAEVANGLPGAGMDALGTALGWDESGWPDFSMYYPVFEAAQGARIYGAALPRERVRAAFGSGAAEVFGAGARRFGLDAALPAEVQATREAEQMAAHCDALPEEMLPGMVAAQRLRDAHFARVTVDALEETGGPVVVITGNGHARTDWGMPAALALAAPDVSVLSLGQLEGAPEEAPPYDLWRVSGAPEREDPCAAFR
jgi:uncharacterized iron-regulated protein